MKERVLLYTDGSVSKPQNKEGSLGGWGYVVVGSDGLQKGCGEGYQDKTTISRMELMALKEGLDHVIETYPAHHIEVFSDSMYCVRSMNEWSESWIKRGWKTAAGKEVSHKDLMQYLVSLKENNKITFSHIKAHQGHIWNDQADSLAQNWRTVKI